LALPLYGANLRKNRSISNNKKVIGVSNNLLAAIESAGIRPQVTQAVIYGWHDNKMGSNVNMLGDRTVSVAESK